MRRYLVICLTLAIPLSLAMLLTLAIPWSGWRARNDVVMAGETESSRSPAEIGPTLPLTPVEFLNICDRDPNVCPVDQVTWQGEPNGWQSTYKRWQRHTGTAAGSEVIWYGSAPYSGSNPNYAHYREIRYMDFTYTPDGYPSVPGTPPITYEWQPWEPITNNYILHQYAGASESLAPLIGATACGTGVYYPLVDETSSFSYTPMSVTRNGECLGGGYIVAHLVELWGGPLSLTRMDKCDDVDLGIPVSQSPRGNLVCKISPYAGTVYQGYVWGAGSTPSTPAVAGCEAVIYAWGWANPSQVTSGQDYAARFRNGELRFSKWINLSGQLSGTLPTPNDYAWWNSRCALAWRDVPNLLYSGVYKIGTSIYTDTIGAFSNSIVLPTSGGAFTSTFDGTEYFFPPDIFTETVRITHTMLAASEVSLTAPLLGVNRFYQTEATYVMSGKAAQPLTGKAYTVTIHYADADRTSAIESTLQIYQLHNGSWVSAGLISTRNPDDNIIVSAADGFSVFGVLGQTNRLLFPQILHSATPNPNRQLIGINRN